MFVFVITALSAAVELQLIHDVVKDVSLMFFWSLYGYMHFHMLNTFIFCGNIWSIVPLEV